MTLKSLPDGLEAAAGTGSRLTALRVLRAPLRRGTPGRHGP